MCYLGYPKESSPKTVVEWETRNYAQPDSSQWEQIWRETSVVTAEEWEGIKVALWQSYDRIKGLVNDTVEWPSEREIGGAIAMIVHTAYHIVHTAYHLGEIRQALCVVKQ